MSQNEAPESKRLGIEEDVIKKNRKFLIGVILFWLGSPLAIKIVLYLMGRTFFVDAGTVGDVFGAVNALFSGLAFAFIVITLNLQREELRLQRQEIRYQVEEMRNQSKELAHQHEEMTLQREEAKIQRFNSMFFSLLDYKTKALSDLKWTRVGSDDHREGIEALNIVASEEMRTNPRKIIKSFDEDPPHVKHVKQHICSVYHRIENSFSGYLCSVEALISSGELIDIDEKQARKYFEIIKRSLHPSEKKLLVFLLKADCNPTLSEELKKLKFSEEDFELAAKSISSSEDLQELFRSL